MNIEVDDLYLAIGRLVAQTVALEKRIAELEALVAASDGAAVKVPTDWGPSPKEGM